MMRFGKSVKITASAFGVGLILCTGMQRATAQSTQTADSEFATLNLDNKKVDVNSTENSDENSSKKKSAFNFSPWYLLSGLLAIPFLSGSGGSSPITRDVSTKTPPIESTGSPVSSFPVTSTGIGTSAQASPILYSLPVSSVILQDATSTSLQAGVPSIGPGVNLSPVTFASPSLPTNGVTLPLSGGGVGALGGTIAITPEASGLYSGLAALLTIGGSGFSLMVRKRRAR